MKFHMARRICPREILRLKSVNGLSQNAIARIANVSKHSVQNVFEEARERVTAQQARQRVQLDVAEAARAEARQTT